MTLRSLLALMFVSALAACGPADEPSDPPPAATSEPAPAATPEATPAASPASTPASTPATAGSTAPNADGACSDGRLVQSSWQGEYPAPIVHIESAKALPARSGPCAPKSDRTCTPKPGLYHPWSRRQTPTKAGLAPFVTVRGVDRYAFQKDHTWAWEADEPVAVKKGEIVEVLFYAGEGYCELRFRGRTFSDQCPELHEEGLLKAEGPERPEDDEVQLFFAECTDGEPAWLEGSQDIFGHPGVSEGELIEYGRVGPAGGGACGVTVLQGRDGTFQANGRAFTSLPRDHKKYKGLIGEAIGEEAAIEQLWKGDLQGDGTDEILFEAKGRKSGASSAGVRGLVDGKVVTALMDGSMNKSDPSLRLHGVADVDGDGTLEVVTSRKGQLAAFHIRGAKTEPADDERCRF